MKYFKRSEFGCKCGCGLTFDDMDYELLHLLDLARDIADVPFKINSSIRCEKHNRKVGGKPTSSHLSGCAVDISATNSNARIKIVNALLEVGAFRIGIAKSFIHFDVDQSKPTAMWVY